MADRDRCAHASLADLVQHLRQRREAAGRIAGNDAASAESRAQARDWVMGLDVLLAMFGSAGAAFTAGEAHQLVQHWRRLFTALADELRAGLHVCAADEGTAA